MRYEALTGAPQGSEPDSKREWLAMLEALGRLLGPEPARVVQTHISAVVVGGDRVLKIKKPVDFGFLDNSTLDRRREACEAEVRLNSRLSPDLYLGVVPVSVVDGEYRLGEGGEVVEYAVHMRRLPDELMLDAVVSAGRVAERHVREIAERLWRFHDEARRGPDVAVYGRPDAIRRNWDENFEQAGPYVGRTLDAEAFEGVRAWVERRLTLDAELFERRADGGWVREGHGDVRCESVCLTSPVTIFDCIEFNERFRCCDVADEIAFLAMDLAARGRPDLGYYACEQYAALGQDAEFFRLLPFYQCYRAFVRGKVLSFELDESEIPAGERERAGARARHYFELSRRYASPLAAPTFVLVMGLSGSGKTAVARSIGHEFGAVVVSADAVRDRLFATGGVRGLGYGTGPYSPEANRRTYDAAIARAAELAARGESVVLDATFRRAADREAAARAAAEHGARLRVVECRVPADVARERIEARATQGDGLSGATAETLERQTAELEPVSGLSPAEHLVLDTAPPLAEVARRACDWLRGD